MSVGEGSREFGGWVMTGIAALQAMCGSVRYRDEDTTVPATCRSASSTTSTKLARRYELPVHQTVGAKQFRELFDCVSYSYYRTLKY
jgi:hypothetical protein